MIRFKIIFNYVPNQISTVGDMLMIWWTDGSIVISVTKTESEGKRKETVEKECVCAPTPMWVRASKHICWTHHYVLSPCGWCQGLDGETMPRPFLHRAPGGEGRGLGDRAGVGHILGDRQEGGGRERSQENKVRRMGRCMGTEMKLLYLIKTQRQRKGCTLGKLV